jgi:hypothetical protein
MGRGGAGGELWSYAGGHRWKPWQRRPYAPWRWPLPAARTARTASPPPRHCARTTDHARPHSRGRLPAPLPTHRARPSWYAPSLKRKRGAVSYGRQRVGCPRVGTGAVPRGSQHRSHASPSKGGRLSWGAQTDGFVSVGAVQCGRGAAAAAIRRRGARAVHVRRPSSTLRLRRRRRRRRRRLPAARGGRDAAERRGRAAAGCADGPHPRPVAGLESPFPWVAGAGVERRVVWFRWAAHPAPPRYIAHPFRESPHCALSHHLALCLFTHLTPFAPLQTQTRV